MIYESVNQVIIGSYNGLTLFGAKPLPDPIMKYCQFDAQEQTFELKYNTFHTGN